VSAFDSTFSSLFFASSLSDSTLNFNNELSPNDVALIALARSKMVPLQLLSVFLLLPTIDVQLLSSSYHHKIYIHYFHTRTYYIGSLKVPSFIPDSSKPSNFSRSTRRTLPLASISPPSNSACLRNLTKPFLHIRVSSFPPMNSRIFEVKTFSRQKKGSNGFLSPRNLCAFRSLPL
jgi:hypothetical protein